jgi:hypothetical protein
MIKKLLLPLTAAVFAFQMNVAFGQQTPSLQVSDISHPSPMTLNVGYSGEFVYKISNGGAFLSVINTIYFTMVPDADILMGDSLYLTTYHNDSVSNLFYPGCSSYGVPNHYKYKLNLSGTTIDSNAIYAATGKYSLGQNNFFYLHIPFRVLNCNDTGGSNIFYADSSSVLIDKTVEHAPVHINYGSPSFSITPNILDSASYCGAAHKDTAEVGFLIKNTDVTTLMPYPYADSIRLYLYCTQGVAKLDTNSFRINGVPIPLTYIQGYTIGTYNAYLVKLTEFPASCDPFGTNTLSSVSGFGYADQLTENNTFEFTATVIYDTNCLPFVQLGNTSFIMPEMAVTWDNQCHSLPYHHHLLLPPDSMNAVGSYAYATSIVPSTITVPSDVVFTSPDFYANVCPDYKQSWAPYGFDFDCPNQDYELIMPLGSGYHLNTSDPKLILDVADANPNRSNLYYDTAQFIANHFFTCSGPSYTLNHPTIQEIYSPSDYIVMNFGRLPHCNCGNDYESADVLSCFNVPLQLDCSGNTRYSEDNISFSFQFVCDTAGCSGCGDTLTAANTVTYHHCSGTCGTVVPFTDEGWSFLRTNKGWRNLKLAADSFYTSCTPGMELTNSNLVEDTTVINLSAAYPGDQVEAKVTGGYNNGYLCYTDTNMFLQIRFQPVVSNVIAPHFAFQLDPTINSTFVITGNTLVPSLNGMTLVIPYNTDTVFRSGDWEAMNFSLTRAIQNSAPAQWDSLLNAHMYDSLSVTADIHLRVTSGHTNSPFPFGEHLINLRTEFMDITNTNLNPPPAGDTNPSCDSWGAQFNIYQPGTDIGFDADQYTITDCGQFTPAIRFRCSGAANSHYTDDFKDEFRPYAELDSIVTVVVPAGYIFDSANYQVDVDNYLFNGSTNYFAGGQALHFFRVTPHYESNPLHHTNVEDSIVFIGLNNSCFPLMDEKFEVGNGTRGFLNLYTQPICNVQDTSKFYYYAGYKIGTQQSDPAFQYDTNVKGYLYVVHQNPFVSFKSPHTISDSSNTITFGFTLCDYFYASTEAWVAIENFGGDSLLLSTATLENTTTHTFYDSVFYDSGNGLLFKIGAMPVGACYNFVLTALIDPHSASCPEPVGADTGRLYLYYGNVCGDTITIPDASCQDSLAILTYHVYKTTLQVFNDSHNFDTISLCSNKELIDTLTIESANIGTVSNPVFWSNVIPGVSIDSVEFTFPCGGSKDTTFKYPRGPYHPGEFDTVTGSISGGGFADVGWVLNKDLGRYGLIGLRANDTICAIVYMKLNCHYNAKDSILFYVSGKSTCDIVIADSVSILPKVDSLCFPVSITSINPKCFGDSGTATASVTGGNPPYTYLWSNGATTATITGLTAGTYSVMVKDSNGCRGIDTVTIIQPIQLKDSMIIISNINCSTGVFASASTTVSGGTGPYTYYTGFAIAAVSGGTPPYTYLWSNGNTTATVSGLTAGSYTLVVTDSLGCQATDSITVTGCAQCYLSQKYDLIINDSSASSIHAGPTTYSCENILIIGTYTVDEDVTIQNCNVAFAPHAKINVINNKTLYISSGISCSGYNCPHLYAACDTMWSGIFINPGSTVVINKVALIEDADSALVSINSATAQGLYYASGVTFNKNYKDIVVETCPAPFNGFASFCLFTCRDLSAITPCQYIFYYNSAPFTSLLPPYSLPYSYMGMDIDTVRSIKVEYGDIFDNKQYGICAHASSLEVFSDRFKNIGFTAGYGAGVIDTGMYDHLDKEYLIVDSNNFYNCYNGIVASDWFTKVTVLTDSIIDSVSVPGIYGVYVSAMDYPYANPLNIQENMISNFNTGIEADMNQYVSANINYNNISETSCDASITWKGISINEFPHSPCFYNVDVNNITSNNYGIVAVGVENSVINDNTVTLGANGCPIINGAGIALKANGKASQIGCNFISTPDSVNLYTGIVESQSINTLILNNTTNLTDIHIRFNSTPFNGDNAFDNNLNVGSTGILCSAGAMAFYNIGTLSDPADNFFNSFATCQVTAPLSMVYYWHLYNPTTCPGFTHHYLSFPDSNPCLKPPSPPIILRRDIIAQTADSLSNAVDSATITAMKNTALSKDTFTVLKDTNMPLAQKGVATALSQNASLLSDPVFQHFNDSISNASMGQILAIDTTAASASSSVDYSGLLNNLNAITPASNIEANMQISGTAFLNYKLNHTLSPSQLATLRTLANKCPDWDGVGVYEARAILSRFDPPGTEYSDSCNTRDEHSVHRKTKTTQTVSQPAFSLYPNPNNGNFTLEYDLGEGILGRVVLYNTIGEQVGEYQLNGSAGKLSIYNPELSNGVYIWKLYSNAQIIKFGKVIVIK